MGKEIRPDKVAVYIRWSTDDQGTGTTLDTQKEACTHYLRSQGWTFSPNLLFVDDGYSGGTLDRPGMRKLRRLVDDDQVDCVVIYKIDRLSRNIVDAVQLVLSEWDDKCHVKSVTEPIDTTQELGRMIFGILAMFADFERSTIRERTQTGKMRRIAEGQQMHSRMAFGYAKHPTEKGVWIENPQEAPIVRRIFQMASQGISANKIVKALNEEGIRTRRGKYWTLRGVLWILHNTTYMGVIEYGKSSFKRISKDTGQNGTLADVPEGRSVRVYHDKPKIRTKTNAAPALVDEKLFETVQLKLKENLWHTGPSGHKAQGSEHLLVGISKCQCGFALTFKDTHTKSGKVHSYYRCAQSKHGICTKSGYIPAEAVEAAVENEFLTLFGVPRMRMDRIGPHMLKIDSNLQTAHQAMEATHLRLKKLQKEDAKILRAAREGEIELKELKDLRTSIEDDKNSLLKEVAQEEARVEELKLKKRSLEATLRTLDSVENWSNFPVWRKRQILRTVLKDKIVITKDKGKGKEVSIECAWAY